MSGQPRPRPSAEAVLDQKALRSVLGAFATGVTVLTAGDRYPHGMTANSFTSVSLYPPLVLVCVRKDAIMHDAILGHGAFAVSVLSSAQEPAARYFADRNRPRGFGEFDPIDHAPGPHTGAPLLSGALAWVECALSAVYEGGDHSIFLGSVLEAVRGTPRGALLFVDGGFHRFDPG
jgi:flavin reductase (DIM6/NTAB) family NADH-FMN oxidoreductase RutF